MNRFTTTALVVGGFSLLTVSPALGERPSINSSWWFGLSQTALRWAHAALDRQRGAGQRNAVPGRVHSAPTPPCFGGERGVIGPSSPT
jgi:hypothetical protein